MFDSVSLERVSCVPCLLISVCVAELYRAIEFAWQIGNGLCGAVLERGYLCKTLWDENKNRNIVSRSQNEEMCYYPTYAVFKKI